MVTKAELREDAESLGIEVQDDWTKADIESAIQENLDAQAWERGDEYLAEAVLTPAPDPVQDEPVSGGLGRCDNCGSDAVWESDGITASKVKLCGKHKPRGA